MSSISKIIGAVNAGNGVASPTRFKVSIAYPAAIASNFIKNSDALVMVESVEIPGRQIATTPQMIYGVTRKMPYGVVYQDLSMTFICTNSMSQRTIFDGWHSLITDPTNNYFNYYDNYKSTIIIQKLDEQNNISYTVVVDEAYPVTVESQQLDANATDQYLRCTVQFAYRRWRTLADIQLSGTAFNTDVGDIIDNPGIFIPGPWFEIPFLTKPASPFDDK